MSRSISKDTGHKERRFSISIDKRTGKMAANETGSESSTDRAKQKMELTSADIKRLHQRTKESEVVKMYTIAIDDKVDMLTPSGSFTEAILINQRKDTNMFQSRAKAFEELQCTKCCISCISSMGCYNKDTLFTPEVLEYKIEKLQRYCLTDSPDTYRIHVNREKGVQLLETLMERSKIEEVDINQSVNLIWCSMSCVNHFNLRLRTDAGIFDTSRRKAAQKATGIFEELLQRLLPDKSKIVLTAIFIYFSECALWKMEFIVAELLRSVLKVTSDRDNVFNDVLDIAEKTVAVEPEEGRQIIRTLYQILETHGTSTMSIALLDRFLSFYHRCILPTCVEYNYLFSLKGGLEVCLRKILDNVNTQELNRVITVMMQWTFDESISDEVLLDFGNILEYATMKHKSQFINESLSDELFPLILRLIGSGNRLHSLLGNRVFQHLIDRHGNRFTFDTPRIYFQDTHFNVIIGEYSSEDKRFIKKYREALHEAFLSAFVKHGMHRVNLESTYASLSIIVVEIPCGYIAASTVCLAMGIQEATLNSELDMECCHRLHATVMALMSLVCWVHKAKVFYDYLNQVLYRRAQWAPFLNPPLRATYQYPQHLILYKRPDLFFEDWECRFGLWNCFRCSDSDKKRATKVIGADSAFVSKLNREQ